MLWPILISMAAVIVFGVPFTYYWFRWSDRWATSEKKRFGVGKSGEAGQEPIVRVIKSEPTDPGGR